MRTSQLTAEFSSHIEAVWDAVTDNSDYAWRSDLERIEVSEDGKSFTEYTKDGFSTHFIIQKKDRPDFYSFTMENPRFTGEWTGEFSRTASGGTKIVFTEKLWIKNPVMELLSHLLMNLKKIQETYAADLKKKLGEQ